MFAELERRVADKRAAGIDVISLGIGDPDRPTYPHIVEAMREAVADPANHRYPSNRGREEFRTACRVVLRRVASGSTIDPDSEAMPAIGAKECIYNLCFAFLDPDDIALAADPGYPVYTGGPTLAGARRRADAAGPGARLRAGPRADGPDGARQRPADVPQLPQQPDRRGGPRRASSSAWSRSPASTRSSSSTTTRTRRRRSTATSRRASSPLPGRWRSGSRSSRSRRGST